MDKVAPLVHLFRCKDCGVRVFEQDAKGHLERHGISGVNGDWRTYFVRGKRDTFKRPGDHYKPMYQRMSKKQAATTK